MKLSIIIFQILSLILSKELLGQSDLSLIKFKYVHSMRSTYSTVKIVIRKSKNEITIESYIENMAHRDMAEAETYARALSEAKNKEDSANIIQKKPTDKSTKNSFIISPEQLDKILQSLNKIQITDISANFDVRGLDGSNCYIEIGSEQNFVKYSIWSPEHKTKERNLLNFYNACVLILQTANLKPADVFD